MQIILISGPYYPRKSPASNCVDHYIQELLSMGNHVDVICPATTLDTSLYSRGRLTVHRVSGHWTTWRAFCYKMLGKGRFVTFWKCILLIVRLYGIVIAPFSFPTRHAWMKKKLAAVLEKLLHVKDVDAVISVSDPPCAHLAVLEVRKKNPIPKWITYTLDPYTFNPINYQYVILPKYRQERNFLAEQSIYNSADYNIFSKELYEMALTEFSQPVTKTVCFPYIIKRPLQQTLSAKENNGLVIVYAGTLKKSIREPNLMLSVLSKIKNITLRLYVAGDCEHILNRYASPQIMISGFLSQEEYQRVVCVEADILINIGNTNDLQSPSKLVELLSSGKPIIHFYHHQDEGFRMIDKYPLGINVGDSNEETIRMVDLFCHKMKGRKLSFEDVEKLYPENTLKGQMKQLNQMLSGRGE